MHYDDFEYGYGYQWDEDRRWDEEPKAVTSLSENATNLKRLIM